MSPHALHAELTDREASTGPIGSAPVRVIVAGLGRVGLAAASICATHPGFTLAGFVDARADLRAFARGCGFAAPAEARIERAVARGGADAVVICAPVGERAALALAAIEAQLAVLLLHPAAATPAEASALGVRASRRPVCAFTPIAFHPLFERARAWLAANVPGTPDQVHVSVYASRVFGPGARPARGDVLDHYAVDALFLLDRLFGPVASLEASGHRLYGEGFDEAHARLTHRSGLVAGLDVSWSVPGYPRPATVVEVKGARGHLLVSDDALEVSLIEPVGELPAGVTRVVAAEAATPARFDAGGDELWLALEAFRAQVVRGEAPTPIESPLELGRSLRVVESLAALRAGTPHGGEGRRS